MFLSKVTSIRKKQTAIVTGFKSEINFCATCGLALLLSGSSMLHRCHADSLHLNICQELFVISCGLLMLSVLC